MRLYKLVADCYQGYDTVDSLVVRASSEEEARKLAQSVAGDEGGNASFWLDAKESHCFPLSQEGEPEVICRSFNAG